MQCHVLTPFFAQAESGLGGEYMSLKEKGGWRVKARGQWREFRYLK